MHKGWVDKILCAFIYECIIIDQIKSCNKKINITVRFYYIEVPLQLNSIVYLCIHTGGHAVYILLKVTETMERHPSKSHNGHHQDAPWGKNTWKKIPLFISCHHFHEYMCNKWLVSHREQMCPQWSLGNGKRREARQCVCVCACLREKERKKQNGGGFMDEKSSPVEMQILWRPHTLASVTLHSSLSASLPLIKWPRSRDNLISLRGPDTWFNCVPITDLFSPAWPCWDHMAVNRNTLPLY